MIFKAKLARQTLTLQILILKKQTNKTTKQTKTKTSQIPTTKKPANQQLKEITITNFLINLISLNMKNTSFRVQKPPSVLMLWQQPCSVLLFNCSLLSQLVTFTNKLPISIQFVCSRYFFFLTLIFMTVLYSNVTFFIIRSLSSTSSLFLGKSKTINRI